jgi:hypothetical protein
VFIDNIRHKIISHFKTTLEHGPTSVQVRGEVETGRRATILKNDSRAWRMIFRNGYGANWSAAHSDVPDMRGPTLDRAAGSRRRITF